MAFLTLLVVGTVLFALTLWKRISASRRHRIPSGLKPLPGPKGMALCYAYFDSLVPQGSSALTTD